ncbi:MAG: CDP-alcohol phosphatidyltransferase family protein [Methanoregulaceae archaeon]|jgi:archaetidylinositol phosphate synthase|nr:CDP-alcohol phosphatidyltransferase family protein [Methanoregulaceae archaeon]MCU0628690.1 CDP-alcohol phosphatidyltransferase family protein [Methanoregulaceae archaeon]
MNITALRPRLVRYIEPIATVFCRAGITPNQISLLSLLAGVLCAVFYMYRMFIIGSLFLFISAVLDLVDGSVARRTEKETRFGAVFDWIADKYVDAIVILGVGLSGIAILSRIPDFPPASDFAIVAIAIIGSLMNTFIKPVVYAETGYKDRIGGKIEDPLEGVGFFGRPETILVLLIGGVTGFIWVSVILIAVGTNLSALQRIIYLYGRLS